MAQRMVVDCDRCGKEIPPSAPVTFLELPVRSDVTGDRGYEMGRVEICPGCASLVLLALIGWIGGTHWYERNAALIEWVRKDDAVRLKAAMEDFRNHG